ncbi:unnamed protein product, partial [Hapterophycus canaliculatus]
MIDAGKTPTEILTELDQIQSRLLPHTDVGGPLVILSTVHTLKGLEFDTVVLADDFSFEALDGRPRTRKGEGENTNLVYVAVTRAKRQLFLNRSLSNQLKAYRLWDSLALPGLAKDLAPDIGNPIPCHGYRCSSSDAWELAPQDPDVAAPGSGDGGGGGGGSEGVSRKPRLFFAGSGSTGPLCKACVEGAAGEGEG